MRKDNKNNKRRKLLPALLAVAMAAVMLAPMGTASAEAAEGTDAYSLTVNANENYMKDDPDLTDVTLQIYQVADLNEENAEAGWSLTAPFAAADTDGALGKLLTEVSKASATSSEEADAIKQKYRQIEGRATHCIIESNIAPTVTSTFGTKQSLSQKGIYLVIPVSGSEIKSDGAGNATVETESYTYTFLPVMLFVPGVDTAELAEGEWAYGYGDCTDVVVNPKQSRKEKTVTTPAKTTTKKSTKTVTNTHKVKTGDEFPVLPILVAVVAVILLVLIRRRGESESR